MSAPPDSPGLIARNYARVEAYSNEEGECWSPYDLEQSHLDLFSEEDLDEVESLIRSAVAPNHSSTPPQENTGTSSSKPGSEPNNTSRRNHQHPTSETKSNKGVPALEGDNSKSVNPTLSTPTKRVPNPAAASASARSSEKRGTARPLQPGNSSSPPKKRSSKPDNSTVAPTTLVKGFPLLGRPAKSVKSRTPRKLFAKPRRLTDSPEKLRAQATRETFGGPAPSPTDSRQTVHTTPSSNNQYITAPPLVPASPPPPGTTTAFASIFGANASAPTTPTTPISARSFKHRRPSPMSAAASALGVTAPGQSRTLRACMVCSIIQTHSIFLSQGCPNCETALQLAGNPDAVNECTSSNYNGIVAIMDGPSSWVARYHRLDGYAQGMYAVQVVGTLSEGMVEQVRSAGMRFVRRDGGKEEDLEME